MAEKTILDRSLDVELLAVDMLQLNKIWLGASNDQPVPAEDAAFSVQQLSYVAANGITNVKSKGAVGDGVTSDHVAIQAALNGGGLVFFPPGIYRCGVTLNVPAGTRMMGASRIGSCLSFLDIAAGPCITAHSSTTIQNLKMIGSGALSTSSAIATNGLDPPNHSQRVTVDNCHIEDFLYGVLLNKSVNWNIQNCAITSCYAAIASTSGFCHALNLRGNDLTSNSFGGILLQASQNGFMISGNYIGYNDYVGMAISGASYVRGGAITGNRFVSNDLVDGANSEDIHINLANAKGIAVSGNSFESGNYYAVRIDQGQDVFVGQNYFVGGAPSPVFVAAAAVNCILQCERSSLQCYSETSRVNGIVYRETTKPADGVTSGLYSVQTGAAERGLYISTGVGPVQVVTLYSADGDWPA